MDSENAPLNTSRRLVVFDVEGVLIPKGRYVFEVGKTLGSWKLAKIILFVSFYQARLLSVESTLKRIFKVLGGVTAESHFKSFSKIPLMSDAEEVFEELKRTGYETALISSGLPQVFVEYLAAKLKADFAFGIDIDVVDGRLTGDIRGDVIKPRGKAIVLERLIETQGLKTADCTVVADDRNNLSMFPLSARQIGYDPDFMVSVKANAVVKSSLSEILPYIMEKQLKAQRGYPSKRIILRKTIHMSSFLLPFICIYLLNRYFVAFAILLAALVYVISEIYRMKGRNIPVFSTLTWAAATKLELSGFVMTPMYLAFGLIFSLVVLPVPYGYASIAILALGDGSAAIFGKMLGRHSFPWNKGKKVEGLIFGVLFGFLGAQFFVNPAIALVSTFVGMLTESFPLPLSDNVTVPIASGLTLLAFR